MSSNKLRAGFTLIELLVVVAIIALLISILLPSLKEAREQGKRTLCLSNIRSVAQGTVAYSTEDELENAIPIQQQMVSTHLGDGFPGGGPWALTVALPFAYGGRTAQVPFLGSNVLMDENGRWAARTKPLNRYLYGSVADSDSKDMELYHCPSDDGFPDNPYVYHVPTDGRDVPCYDFIGNSYRFNYAGVYFGSGSGSAGEITIGPYGHRLSTLENASRQTSLMEPLFYAMTIQATVGPLPDALMLRGWHNQRMTSNVSFLDGSARPTRVQELTEWDRDTLNRMHYGGGRWETFLRRGESWQMDCYPTPAAFVPKFDDSGRPAISYGDAFRGRSGWPFDGAQNNMQPPF